MISLSSIFPTSAFIQGVGIGFSIAIPVGPIGMLCLRRSLKDGRRVGLVSGLGAATADAIYGLIAALGISAVQGFLLDHRFALQLGGGIFLVFLGLRTVWTKPTSDATTAAPRPRNLPAAFGSTYTRQSHDDPRLCGNLCGPRRGNHGGRPLRGFSDGDGGIPRLGRLVATPEPWGRGAPLPAPAGRTAHPEHRVGPRDRRDRRMATRAVAIGAGLQAIPKSPSLPPA